MAKKMTPGAGRNSYDPDKCSDLVRRHENVDKEIDDLKAEIMRKVGALREDQKSIVLEAKDAGLNKKAFKAVLQTRKLERKMEKLRGGLEADEADSYDNIRHALGDLADTPLGGAALGKVEKTEDEHVADNVNRLNEMIGEAAE